MATSFVLKGKVYFTDGTQSAVQNFKAFTGLAGGDAVTLPAGHDQLLIGNVDPTKTVEKYELWVENDADLIVTEIITYVLRSPEYYELDFWFQNSLGVMEAVHFNSGRTSGIEVNKDSFVRAQPFDFNPEIHQLATEGVEFYRTFSATTGFKKRSDIEAYIDMVISKRVYQIIDGQIYPVSINPGSFDIVRESEVQGAYEYALNFEGQIAYSETSYSDVLN